MSKNIVICCDGTGNSDKSKFHTNVYKIYEMTKNINLAYYDPGVSTIEVKGIFSWLKDIFQHVFGYGITQNIKDAYSFLQEHYEIGDKIFLIGFSRGAYTIRSLANLIYCCGICIEAKNIDNAIHLYKRLNNKNEESKFKNNFSQVAEIEFMGIFDTVASLGYLHGKKYFNAELTPEVKHAYHAVAIDEKRKNSFKPELWNDNHVAKLQKAMQVWFIGAHSDVGGGYEESGLSDITLSWIVDQAQALGLSFNIQKLEISPDPYATLHCEKLLINRDRKIPEGSYIHKSVFERQNKTECHYSPENIPNKYKVEK